MLVWLPHYKNDLDISLNGGWNQRLVSVESGLTGLESVVVCGGPSMLWGQESCCSRVCSGQSGHSVEVEQLSHCSPWPQGRDTEPCSPHVTQHCLCFLYTTFEKQRKTFRPQTYTLSWETGTISGTTQGVHHYFVRGTIKVNKDQQKHS